MKQSDFSSKSAEIFTTTDKIVYELRKKIINGEIKPGTQLKNNQLAEEFGTSITPVREALSRLEKLDLAEYRPRCGWFVKWMDDNEVREIYDMRKLLELYAAEQICRSNAPLDLRKLEKYCREYEQSRQAGDLEACIKLDSYFHSAIVELAGNRYASEMMDRLRNLMCICWTVENYNIQGRDVTSDHENIVRFLKTRDLKGAIDVLQRHVTPCG